MREINVGMTITPGLYRHTKSEGLYTVFCLVRHHETGNPMVVYYSHGHGSVSTRPLHGFTGTRCSDPDGFAERFEFIGGSDALRIPAGPGLPATVLWTNDTLLRNFGLFAEALAGVGLRAIDPACACGHGRAIHTTEPPHACLFTAYSDGGRCDCLAYVSPSSGTPVREETPDARLATAVTSLERALEVLRKEQFERAGAKKTPM